MLDKVRRLLETNHGKAGFFGIVTRHYPPMSREHCIIERAYDTAEAAFSDEVRESNGDAYFEHPRCVTLIVMEYMRVRDVDVIVAALLHDLPEHKRKEWPFERLVIEFNQRIAELVWWVTKPPLEDFGGDKEARDRFYHNNLSRAPREAIIVKLADRLHNLLTTWGLHEAKQRRKVRETQDFYHPLAERWILLIHEIEAALSEIMLSWKESAGGCA